MESFVINNITFNVKDNNIVLDKSSNILKHRFCYTHEREEEIKTSKLIINDICTCILFCKAINEYYKTYRHLECFKQLHKDIPLDMNIKEIIYNTRDKNITRNIFEIQDVNYLKRIAETKLETLKRYDTKITSNNNFEEKRSIQRRKLFKLKK